ncbi:MAG: hypothetical protein U5K54_11625 [Cytophagales bacterium]|nr:hypothetical protein [Cytophagales bacterium]
MRYNPQLKGLLQLCARCYGDGAHVGVRHDDVHFDCAGKGNGNHGDNFAYSLHYTHTGYNREDGSLTFCCQL